LYKTEIGTKLSTKAFMSILKCIFLGEGIQDPCHSNT